MMKLRRQVRRQPAGWVGTCHLEGESAAAWRASRVTDISMHGLGMTLKSYSPTDVVGQRISINGPAVGDSASIRLDGRIANAALTPRGDVRVGIEFGGLSPSECEIARDHSDHEPELKRPGTLHGSVVHGLDRVRRTGWLC
jgi:hypothetical protein